MKSSTFTFKDQDGIEIFVYKWEPDNSQVKGCIQFSHGLAEHALRYQYVADYLTQKGFICYADDHRGHGKSIKDGNKGYLGPNGWDGTVNSIHELTNIIKKENPNQPVFFLGHSWGSFLGQDVIQQWGSDYKGIILSGTRGGANKIQLKIGGILARRAAKKSPTAPNKRLDDMNLKPLNKRWAKEPGATTHEWLCSDKEVVKKYLDDPLCGFTMPSGFFVDMLNGFNKIWKKSNEQKIPKNLPIYFLAGELCPVSQETKSIDKLMKRYQSYGIKDIEHKYYPNDRHEIYNEVNKKEVYEDVANWLEKHC